MLQHLGLHCLLWHSPHSQSICPSKVYWIFSAGDRAAAQEVAAPLV